MNFEKVSSKSSKAGKFKNCPHMCQFNICRPDICWLAILQDLDICWLRRLPILAIPAICWLSKDICWFCHKWSMADLAATTILHFWLTEHSKKIYPLNFCCISDLCGWICANVSHFFDAHFVLSNFQNVLFINLAMIWYQPLTIFDRISKCLYQQMSIESQQRTGVAL